MFDNLSERLERSFKILKGEGKITEINVAETLKDVRKALLDELKRKYPQCRHQDASFQEYGFGATMVTIK